MQWMPIIGGGVDGIKLASSALVGEELSFTVANCTRIGQGVILPDWAVPPGATWKQKVAGSQELCTACEGRKAEAGLHQAKKEGGSLSATYHNCTHGNSLFTFTLPAPGIWNLRATMGGQPAAKSPIIRAEERDDDDDDDRPPP
eukprot:CAMPEP_0114151266 /NCGR_PEP_ID=MMETSP0043_2-20121206/23163_1 /TAXON_ID=464988 /ORGANISM="Hemiselmis andersenii, Strain CCMP644" /LENGTH=143 /DNA_ID=CAMNT_0001246089 /DNA_START=1 /DNA_END=429 /DNA_ORIENTATION=-